MGVRSEGNIPYINVSPCVHLNLLKYLYFVDQISSSSKLRQNNKSNNNNKKKLNFIKTLTDYRKSKNPTQRAKHLVPKDFQTN